MDSMLGYTNDKYINFGRTAARLDDVLNYIPSRLTALLMILSAYILKLDGKTLSGYGSVTGASTQAPIPLRRRLYAQALLMFALRATLIISASFTKSHL